MWGVLVTSLLHTDYGLFFINSGRGTLVCFPLQYSTLRVRVQHSKRGCSDYQNRAPHFRFLFHLFTRFSIFHMFLVALKVQQQQHSARAHLNANVAAALAIRRSGGHLGLGRRLVAPPFRRSSPLKVDPRASGRRASRCASTVLYVSRSLLYYNYKESIGRRHHLLSATIFAANF